MSDALSDLRWCNARVDRLLTERDTAMEAQAKAEAMYASAERRVKEAMKAAGEAEQKLDRLRRSTRAFLRMHDGQCGDDWFYADRRAIRIDLENALEGE